MRLTSRIVLLLTLVTAGMVGLYSFVERRSREVEIRADAILRLRLLLAHANPALANALWNVDPLAARAAMLSFFETDSTSRMSLFTAEGAPFLSIRRTQNDLSIDDSASNRTKTGEFSREFSLPDRPSVIPKELPFLETVSPARPLGPEEFRVTSELWFQRDDQKEFLGHVVVEFHTREVRERVFRLRLRILAFSGILMAGIVSLSVLFLRRAVILRVRRLEQASVATTSGSAQMVPVGRGNDELESLNRHFNTMVQTLVAAIASEAERARLEGELKAAEAVQSTLLPSTTEFPSIQAATHYSPAADVGGDWFWFFHDPSRQRLFTFVGDVTGHGVPSALITALVAGAAAALMRAECARDATPEEILQAVCLGMNAVVLDTGRKAGRYMTMLLTCLDTETGDLTLLNAGHPPPFIVGAGRSAPIPMEGNPLGTCTTPEHEIAHRTLKPGELLFAYTDGLLENKSIQGEMLSRRTLKAILESQTTPQERCETLRHTCETLWKGCPPADDVTFLFVGLATPT